MDLKTFKPFHLYVFSAVMVIGYSYIAVINMNALNVILLIAIIVAFTGLMLQKKWGKFAAIGVAAPKAIIGLLLVFGKYTGFKPENLIPAAPVASRDPYLWEGYMNLVTVTYSEFGCALLSFLFVWYLISNKAVKETPLT
jgi:hypothetical protein